MSVLTIIALLRWVLVVQALTGFVLSVAGIQTAILDLVELRRAGFNGGKRLANVMRLQKEICLTMGFAGFLVVGLFFMSAYTEVTAANWWRMVGSRVAFNVSMFALLLMKVLAYRGRKQLDAYYDQMAASGVPVEVERARERMASAMESQRVATAAQVVASEAQDEASKALRRGDR